MFGSRITLFELSGFKVRVDASWLLLAFLIIWALAEGYFPYVAPGLGTATYWWMAVAGLIGLAFSIIIHEFAHSLVARRFDMPIRGITLFIFGGVAEMEEEPSSAKGEALMALAGPATSVLIALLFFGVGFLFPSPEAGENYPPLLVVTSYLAFINGLLAVFNMLPAFPLDGGRVLRAALWGWKGDLTWATRIAGRSGKIFGILLILGGLYAFATGNFVGGVWWVLIGLFVRATAAAAVQQQLASVTFSGEPVHRFMERHPVSVEPSLPVDQLVDDYFYRYYLKTFPVTDHGRLVGCVTLDKVMRMDAAEWPARRVRDVMEDCDDTMVVAEGQEASKALTRMRRSGRRYMLVTEGDGLLVGVLPLRNLLNFLAMRQGLGKPPMPPPANDRWPAGRIGRK